MNDHAGKPQSTGEFPQHPDFVWSQNVEQIIREEWWAGECCQSSGVPNIWVRWTAESNWCGEQNEINTSPVPLDQRLKSLQFVWINKLHEPNTELIYFMDFLFILRHFFLNTNLSTNHPLSCFLCQLPKQIPCTTMLYNYLAINVILILI